jgi:hypothetical protein
MTYQRKIEVGAVAAFILAAAFVFSLSFSHRAQANPLGFSCAAQTASATTTPVYMTAGTATSTLLFDTYCVNGTNQPNTGNTNIANKLTLLTQFSASSTASVLGISVEYSQDGVDWYQDNYLSPLATTSPAVLLATPNSYSWLFASSTLDGVANTGNRVGKALQIQTPTRYVRVVYTLTGTNAAVWGELLPQKEDASR